MSLLTMDAAADPGGMLELLSFEIAGQEFCIDVRSVREIRGWTPTTLIPKAPDYILGVINLRGIVMPVIDLRCRLGLGLTEPSSRHVIVVVQHAASTAGFLVDSVQETFQLACDALQAPPLVGPDAGDGFIDAIIPLDGRMLSRLVVGSLLPRAMAQAA